MRIQRFALHTVILCVGLWLIAIPSPHAAEIPSVNPQDGLTLSEALALAAQNRPELKTIGVDFDAATNTQKNSSRPPNPELGVEWDNLGGNTPADDVQEVTISLSQPFEIGGKPSARKKSSQAETLRLQQEQATAWLNITTEVRMAFLEVLAAKERLVLQDEAQQITTELARITRERVAAGELAATEEIRAEARKAEAIANTQRVKRILTEAGINLAAVLMEEGVMISATEKLPQEIIIPDQHTLLEEIKKSHLLALYQREHELAAANLSLEQANSWADPSVSLAVREIPKKDARALSIGFSIPLPLFQRNQAAIAMANATAQKSKIKQDTAARQLRIELIRAHAVLVAADQEARTLRNEVLSRATEAAEAVREGFKYGKFRYSDVLEASQSQLDVKTRYLDAILELNRGAITLDHLVGSPSLFQLSQNYPTASLNRSIQ